MGKVTRTCLSWGGRDSLTARINSIISSIGIDHSRSLTKRPPEPLPHSQPRPLGTMIHGCFNRRLDSSIRDESLYFWGVGSSFRWGRREGNGKCRGIKIWVCDDGVMSGGAHPIATRSPVRANPFFPPHHQKRNQATATAEPIAACSTCCPTRTLQSEANLGGADGGSDPRKNHPPVLIPSPRPIPRPVPLLCGSLRRIACT